MTKLQTRTKYTYDDDNVIEENECSGNRCGSILPGPQDGLSPLAMLRSSTTSYFEADGLGSVTSLSNGAGSLAQTYTFDSFGNQTASSGLVANPFRFTGREFDTETNLYYFRARYVDQSTGRFLSEDPLSFEGGYNFYTYTRNNPINFKDPLGWAPDGNCTDCKGQPKQGLDAGKSCCRDTDPMSSSASPVPYSPCDTYMYINAGEMYRNGGDGSWGQLVKGLSALHEVPRSYGPTRPICFAIGIAPSGSLHLGIWGCQQLAGWPALSEAPVVATLPNSFYLFR